MKYAVIAFTVFLITLRSLLMKAASDRDHSLPQILVIFTTAAGTSILTALARGFSLHGSTVVIALAFGVCNFMSQYLNIQAMGLGTASSVTFIVSCSFLISTLYSAVVFREPVTVFRILAIALILAAQVIFCFGGARGRQGGREGRRWLVYAIAAMTFSGIVGIIQKYMQRSAYPGELPEMSAIAATTSSVIAACLIGAKGQWPALSMLAGKRRIATFSLILGVCATVINIVSTYAHAFVDGFLAFPVFNGGSLVLSIIGAHLLFRDRLTTREKLCILIGLVAIAIIGL